MSRLFRNAGVRRRVTAKPVTGSLLRAPTCGPWLRVLSDLSLAVTLDGHRRVKALVTHHWIYFLLLVEKGKKSLVNIWIEQVWRTLTVCVFYRGVMWVVFIVVVTSWRWVFTCVMHRVVNVYHVVTFLLVTTGLTLNVYVCSIYHGVMLLLFLFLTTSLSLDVYVCVSTMM